MRWAAHKRGTSGTWGLGASDFTPRLKYTGHYDFKVVEVLYLKD
jgi:hypothetical protein